MFRNRGLTCRFLTKMENVFGYWQKRDCPGDGLYFPCALEECVHCGKQRLRPHDPNLNTVECAQ